MRLSRIQLFEEFSAAPGDAVINCIKLIDNEGVVIDKPGKSIDEDGIRDGIGSSDYMGGVADDGTILGVNGGYVKEGSALAKEYPHLVTGCAMNDKEELFDLIPGAKYQGQRQFKKIGKFEQ